MRSEHGDSQESSYLQRLNGFARSCGEQMWSTIVDCSNHTVQQEELSATLLTNTAAYLFKKSSASHAVPQEGWLDALLMDTAATLFEKSSASMQVITNWSRPSISEIGKYGSQTIASSFRLLARCVTEKEAPPIFSDTHYLLKKDFFPVFCANFLFYFFQFQQEKYKENFPECVNTFLDRGAWVFGWALFLFTALRNVQFYVHTWILLKMYPDAFHAIKKDIPKIDNAVCAGCNNLDYAKGEVLSLLVYLIRQCFLEYVKKFPLGSFVAYPLQLLFIGEVAAEYHYGSEGVCGEHRKINFKRYFELFFTLGLFHELATQFFTLATTESIGLAKLKFENKVGDVFLISSMLQAAANIPGSVYTPFIGGALLIYVVGMAYQIPFPKPMATTHRSFPTFGVHWLAERLFKLGALEIKDSFRNGNVKWLLKKWKKSGAKPAVVAPASPQPIEYEDTTQIEAVLVESTEPVRHIATTSAKAESAKSPKNGDKDSKTTEQFKPTLSMVASQVLLPPMFHSTDGILKDPLVARYWPKVMAQLKVAMESVLSYRQFAITAVSWVKKINSLSDCNPKVKAAVAVAARVCGLSFVTDIAGFFTVDFILYRSTGYLDFLQSLVNDLKWVFGAETSKAVNVLIEETKKNIGVVKKVMNDLPPSMMDGFFAWVQKEEFIETLRSVCGFVDNVLSKYDFGLETMGYDVAAFEGSKAMTNSESVDDCAFPKSPARHEMYVEVRAEPADGVKPATVVTTVRTVKVSKSDSDLNSGDDCVVVDTDFDPDDIPKGKDFEKKFGKAPVEEKSDKVFTEGNSRRFFNSRDVAAAAVAGTAGAMAAFQATSKKFWR